MSLRFGAMILTAMIVMYWTMFVSAWELDHVHFSESRVFMPTGDDGLLAEPNATDEEFEEAARKRAAHGWDDDAVSQLQGPDVPGELTARLADMPSCLDQLAAAAS
jgi:hypothetical protein